MEKTNHLSGRVLPFAKTLGVGARHETFKRERHREVMVVHTWRSIVLWALNHKSRAHCSIVVEINPLTRKHNVWINLKKVLTLVNDFIGEAGPTLYICNIKVELSMCLLPWEKGLVLTIPNVINTLDAFTVEFMCTQETITYKFKTNKPTNAWVMEFHESAC